MIILMPSTPFCCHGVPPLLMYEQLKNFYIKKMKNSFNMNEISDPLPLPLKVSEPLFKMEIISLISILNNDIF